MSASNISHPTLPPSWLEHWLTEGHISALFNHQLRQTSLLIMRNERHFQLRWSDDSLTAIIGAATATWRHSAAGWQCRCQCGFPGPVCSHAYGAHVLLRQVCRENGWKMPTQTPNRQTSNKQIPTTPIPGSGAFRQPDFFSDLPSSPHSPARPLAPLAMRLEVEVDRMVNSDEIAVRFYLHRGEDRFLAPLASVRNHAAAALALDTELALQSWSSADLKFMRWLLPTLRRLSRPQLSLRALPLSSSDFNRWLNRWSAEPRFIDRRSREFLNSVGLSTPTRLLLEVTSQGDWLQVAAIFLLANGRRLAAHELFLHLQNCSDHDPVRQLVRDFTPPVSWETLREFFQRKSPRINRSHVVSHLSQLIDGRLDLISGNAIRKIELEAKEIHLHVSQRQRQFIFRAEHLDRRLDLSLPACQDFRLQEINGNFQITIYSGRLFTWLQELRDLVLRQDGVADNGELRLPAISARAAELRQLWNELPLGVRKTHDQQLSGLLETDSLSLQQPTLHLTREGQGLMRMQATWQIGAETFSLHEMQEARQTGLSLLQGKNGGWLYIDPQKLQPMIDAMTEAGIGDDDTMLVSEARQTIGKLNKITAWQVESDSRQFYERLRQAKVPDKLPLPEELATVLRSYQKVGTEFLLDRCQCGVGPILADDMGLGKTLQVLAMLAAWKTKLANEGKRLRALVLCPASVIAVWLQQCQQFCPWLEVAAIQGDRETRSDILANSTAEVLITHYGLARIDSKELQNEQFTFVILDEAQAIKNPQAETTRAVKRLRRQHSLALTGTPLENRVLDLWSIMDFLNPGYLGEIQEFAGQAPSGNSLQRLTRRLAPVMLRRRKEIVAPELPPRTEQVLSITMPEDQQEFYDRILLQAREMLASQGAAAVLASLLRLRQACCAPELVRSGARDITSAKVDTLLEMLDELRASGHSALVFSQFTSMLEIISRSLDEREVNYFSITGETPIGRRHELVRSFTDSPEPSVFLLSLRAAGTGLTLTRADYVFLFDPWWNPAVERQAIDRTHRIGQEKPVMAYRLIMKNTVEEKVLAMLQEKSELFNQVMDGAAEWSPETGMSLAEMKALLQ